MIKNNLNIAQQVNCSGISSPLFLFFDSKARRAGYVPRVWGLGFPQAVASWSFPGTDGDGKPVDTTVNIPRVAKPYSQPQGRAMWHLSLPTNLPVLQRKKGIKERTNARPAIQTQVKREEGEVEANSVDFVTVTNQT